MSLTLVDAFAGAGGLSLGLHQAGMRSVLAFDADEAAMQTYARNIAPVAQCLDMYELDAPRVLELAGVDQVDVLAGGPPCQGFSSQNRTGSSSDERNHLVVEFLRLVSELQPRAFLMENVAQIAGKRGQQVLKQLHLVEQYDLTGHTYLAAEHGVAQTRRRFILIGIRRDQPGTFEIPPALAKDRWLTVADAIADLPEPPLDAGVSHERYANHYRTAISALNLERFSHVPQGGGWRDIPYDLRLACHQQIKSGSGGWPDVYGRLEWAGQCPTITGGFDSFTRGRYGHPDQDRAITPREAARIQGFPDDFVFSGSRDQVRRQIGNAVPPPLARAIGVQIVAALSQR